MSFRSVLAALVIIIISSLKGFNSFAQNHYRDSIENDINIAVNDSNKVNKLLDLSDAMLQSYDYEKSCKYGKQALELATRINYEQGIASAYWSLSSYYLDANRLDDAVDYATAAMSIYQKNNDTAALMGLKIVFAATDAYSGRFKEAILKFDSLYRYYENKGAKGSVAFLQRNIGMTYGFLNNFAEAERYNIMALRYYEKNNDLYRIAECYNLSGDTYKELRNLDDAINEYYKALNIYRGPLSKPEVSNTNDYRIGLMLCSIGEVFLLQKKTDSAKYKLQEALTIIQSRKLNWAYRGVEGRCMAGLGQLKEQEGDSLKLAGKIEQSIALFENARSMYSSALVRNIENGYGNMAFENENIRLNILLGNINLKLRHYTDAGRYLDEGLTLAVRRHQKNLLRDGYLHLSELYKASGNASLAFENYEKYIAYRDSISNEESVRNVAFYKMRYETEKTEDAQKKIQSETEVKLKNQKRQKYLYIALIGILALLSLFIFLTFRNQKKISRLAVEAHSKEKAELELQSLRAQLNPHFMFNSLNAIQELILLEENEKSQSYLARFSKLLRMLLENAERPFIPLQREIDFLQLYLSLENLRIPDLQQSITVDPDIDTGQTAIPNMILQPYIENAIWHGLSHKKTDKKVEIRITKANGVIQYEIEDNGVGRKRADEMKSLFRKEHKSKGMELLSKRFKLLSKEYGSDIETIIADVMNNGEVTGTLVTIKVPADLSVEFKN